jgi:hypothetical protein
VREALGSEVGRNGKSRKGRSSAADVSVVFSRCILVTDLST